MCMCVGGGGGWGAEFTVGAREQIYFEVGLGDKTMTKIIVISFSSIKQVQ